MDMICTDTWVWLSTGHADIVNWNRVSRLSVLLSLKCRFLGL
jgi:hypothetical protein